jgi:hypothetical protein
MVPGIQLAKDDLVARLRAEEVLRLVDRKSLIAETWESKPLAFLCWPESAAPTSSAEALVQGLPKESLALLVEPMDGPPAAVLAGADLDTFAAWVRALPL